MNRCYPQRGFALVTVLVLMVVLSLTVFYSAALTRTDTQVVNNLQNEKKAFYVAEAGIQEALYRLSIDGGATVSIAGVNGNGAFVASLSPKAPGRAVPGASQYGIDSTVPTSTSQILFNTSGPVAGTNNTTPTLQPPALRIPYSSPARDSAPVNLSTTTNLTIGWDICNGPNASLGCDPVKNSFYPIRGLPVSNPKPRPVVKIVSTGQVVRANGSTVASRKITAWAADCDVSKGPPNILATGTACGDGIDVGGNNHICAGTVVSGVCQPTGAVQVNAGAASSPLSNCTNAVRTNGGGSVTATEINSVGGAAGTLNPTATTGGSPQADPYAAPVLLPPCYTGGPLTCQGSMITQPGRISTGGSPLPCGGTAALPLVCAAPSNSTLSPGIYYGGIRITGTNVTLADGVYVIAGGGFKVATGTTSVQTQPGGGAMIFNTYNPVLGPLTADSFDLSGGNSDPHIKAPPPGQDFADVVLFQERNLPLNPQPDILIKGGTTGGRELDGLIYAPDALMHAQGNNPIVLGGALVIKAIDFVGGADLTVENSQTPPPACTDDAYHLFAWQDF